jgi:hypothetical protein
MRFQDLIKSAFKDFNFVNPSENFFDGRTILYCLPVIRNVMRIATAIMSIHQARKIDGIFISDIEKKRSWIDISKWLLGSFVADVLPLAFLPFIGTIGAIITLVALITTAIEQYKNCKDVTLAKGWAILTATALSAQTYS